MLIVNYINITNIDNDTYQLFRNAVSEERRMKADHFHFIEDSKRSVCAELLLQYSLFQAVGGLADMDIVYNEYGKPFINDMNGFSYNITHSGKWVAIAYGSTEVGIDIEKIQEGKENIAHRFFADEEKNYIQTAAEEEQAERFIQIWTLKESYIKYLGTGLSTSLYSFSVNAAEGAVTNQNGELQEEIRLKCVTFDTDYYLSVCSREEEVTFQEIRPDELIQFVTYGQSRAEIDYI